MKNKTEIFKQNNIEVQSGVSSFFNPRGNEEEKLQRWMVARLKYKCSITLISLLEARKDNDIVLRMFKSLHIDILKRNITDIYILFMKLYNGKYFQDCFLHVNKRFSYNKREFSNFFVVIIFLLKAKEKFA